MLAFNLISGMLYTQKLPKKSRIPIFLSALVFFVLLYRSPAGLVYYWTLNNLFSLIRNALNKVVRMKPAVGKKRLARRHAGNNGQTGGLAGISDSCLFFLSALLLCLLLGALIPSGVIASSTGEFVDANVPRSPLGYILFCTALTAGFLIWAGIYYCLSGKKGRKLLAQVLVCICCTGFVNYMVFHTNSGTLNDLLRFETDQNYSMGENILNTGVLLTAAGVCLVLYRYHKRLLHTSDIPRKAGRRRTGSGQPDHGKNH